MFHLLLPIVFALAPMLPDGTQLTYEGTIVAAKGLPVETKKVFQLQMFLRDGDGDVAVFWTNKEQGRGGWPWTSRFGRSAVTTEWQPHKDGPTLLYNRGETNSVVPLILPMIAPHKELALGTKWEAGKLLHQVVRDETLNSRDAWVVEAGNNYGVRRTLWIDKEDPVLLKVKETVFMGQGEEHFMEYELKQQKLLSEAEWSAALKSFGRWLSFREQLKLEPHLQDLAWDETQLTLLKDKLSKVVAATAGGPLDNVAVVATRDTQAQSGRSNAVGSLRENIVGMALPKFNLDTIDGTPVTNATHQGKVVVFHFWDYKDTPLTPPYGQIGYLDFMQRRLDLEKATIIGVNTNRSLLQESSRRRSVYSARKLQQFMNLSYPILSDTNGWIGKLGDPRETGAKLPLFVVVGKDGKVAEYHLGEYQVDRDNGLKELKAKIDAELAK
ncbi:MAG: alkyl hydroperoxide reductase subunit AhpC [Pirellulaceae bacterium]|jgi:alkyl hydroperoxide reductase subunit AhpC